jgi:ribose 5-phosphate isomerase B
MKIVLGNDHAGFPLKEHVRSVLERLGHEVLDVGTQGPDPVDFPDVAKAVSAPVRAGEADRGVLVCGTGVGAAIAANKITGIRATVAHDTYTPPQAVEHDDVNVVCLGAWLVGPAIATQVLEEFLDARFSTDPDFRRRVQMLHDMERDMASEDA